MMNFEEFAEAVSEEIRRKAEGTLDVRITGMTKNNGIKLTGITATAEGNNSGPCVYLEKFYEEYENGGMEFDEAVDEIYRLLKKHLHDIQGINISGFLDWETVKGSIYAKLINAGQNKELLGTAPHRMFLDLAVVYYAVISGLEIQGTGTILIRNQHMEMWGQEEENLYEAAMSNMRTDGRPDFNGIKDVIKNVLPDANYFLNDREYQPCIGMYVLTNRSRCYGASEILDKSTLRTIADKIGDGFIVLPSSIHEVIVLEPNDVAEYEKLAGMVQEVNATQVNEEERLSDHVYVYCRSEEVLKVAA